MKGKTSQALFIISCAAALGWAFAVNAQQSEMQTPKPKICVVRPDVQFGQGISAATDPAAPITATFVTDLSGPAADIAALKSRVPLQISAEAAQQSCDYIVDMTVTHKKAGPGMKKLLAALPSLASAIPMLGGAGGAVAGTAAMAAAGGLEAMQTDDTYDDLIGAMNGMAQLSIKKGDSIVLKYQMRSLSAPETVVEKKLDVKATENGEDILSPLLAQCASEVLTAALKDGG